MTTWNTAIHAYGAALSEAATARRSADNRIDQSVGSDYDYVADKPTRDQIRTTPALARWDFAHRYADQVSELNVDALYAAGRAAHDAAESRNPLRADPDFEAEAAPLPDWAQFREELGRNRAQLEELISLLDEYEQVANQA